MTDFGCQKKEDRVQRSESRGQMSEVGAERPTDQDTKSRSEAQTA